MNFSSFFVVVLIGLVAVSNAAPTWHVIDSDILTIDAGVAFINETVGYTAGDANGVGPAILKSVDGGATFNPCNATFGIDILLLDCDAAGSSAVVSSVFGELYTDNDGQTFQPSFGGGISQSVRFLGVSGSGGHKYGVTGQYGKIQGVGISLNSGRTFRSFNANLFTLARYGAFPTDTTWYCAAGEWPSNNSETFHESLRHRKSEFQLANGSFPLHYQRRNANTDGYLAQITKTTDGGQSWTSVFSENGTFYFNGIDCDTGNANHCCAVGEASDSSDAGARIYCTTDGGATWNRTFWSPATDKQGFSLMEIRFVSPNELWAVGAEYGAIAPSAWFLHSTDGGQTWDHGTKPILGYVALSLSMVDANVGYAAIDNVITQASSIAKYS